MKIKLYHFCLLYVLLFSGCVIYNINVHKHIHVEGNGNNPTIKGAELEGNKLESNPDVKPDIDVTIPLK